MKIELKKIKVYDKLSEETTAFTADIYADGKLIGHAKNTGHGGCTDLAIVDRDKYKEVEAWLSIQPPILFTWPDSQGSLELASNLENMVDYLLEEYLQDRDKKKLEKDIASGIVYGIPGKYYNVAKYAAPLSVVLANSPEVVKMRIRVIKTTLKPGETIFNTELLKQLGL